MINKEIIHKYLTGKCTDEEVQEVFYYLKQNPSEIEKYLPGEEWEDMATAEHEIEEGLSERMYKGIHDATSSSSRTIYPALLKVAAIFILVFAIGFFASNDSQLNQGEPIVSDEFKNTEYFNQTSLNQHLTLEDGSTVLLYPGSSIKYKHGFEENKRNIYLEGRAEFSVVRDESKPFTVFCKDIQTTALGTRFEVDGNAANATVRLFEGRVVVKNIEDEDLHTYLAAGETVEFLTTNKLFRFLDLYTKAEISEPVQVPEQELNIQEKRALPEEDALEKADAEEVAPAYLSFENQHLRDIFNILSEKHQVEIVYPTELSSRVNVYVSVASDQPIETLLKNIATALDLDLKKTGEKRFVFTDARLKEQPLP